MTDGGARGAFRVSARAGRARAGVIETAHGPVETPVFMPVGTQATVKALASGDLERLGTQIILGNTYHLALRPGAERIATLGGLHRFMSWPLAILTDSGGFQIFSLRARRTVDDDGVTFSSHIDGSVQRLTPERAMEIQIGLGADIIMAFDECTEFPADAGRVRASMEMTLRWAERSKAYFEGHKNEVPWGGSQLSAVSSQQKHVLRFAQDDKPQQDMAGKTQALFGIVQGGMDRELRRESALRTVEIGFPGYAIGGLSVGEPRELTREIVESTLEYLPKDKPRYLMGVGTPEEIALYAGMGVDMMDCVLPTRAARHGLLFTSEGRVSIKQARYAEDAGPLDPACSCLVCQRYSRAYLRHLYAANELLAQVLNTVHNLHFYLETMRRVRAEIQNMSRE